MEAEAYKKSAAVGLVSRTALGPRQKGHARDRENLVATNKKVIVARFDREPVPGFLQAPEGFTADAVELLSPSGSLVRVPYSEVKAVCFVRDFEDGAQWAPHRAYGARPKIPGLWVRLTFQDGDTSEGMLPNNLVLVEPPGFHIVLPEASFAGQRFFIPKEALRELVVLGVVGSSVKRRPAEKRTTVDKDQMEMF